MRRFWITLVAVPAIFLAGCDAVRRIPDAADDTKVIEAGFFEGGYGIQWHIKIAAQFNAIMQQERVRVELWGDARITEKIKPRLLRGDPPDVYVLSDFPTWRLIAAGKLHPFDEVLDKAAFGGTTPWRDLFIPGTLDMYTSNGHVYSIPSAFGAWACWYDARLFREHGWTVPKTWAEFDALCAAIQAAGIAPVAFQGKYPNYAWMTYISMAQRCGGLAALNRMNNTEPGAFSHPDAVRAARLLQDMAVRHYQKGAMAMTHTESQLQFVNGQAAMIWCGIWIVNEMKLNTPPAFEMRCFTMPSVEGGKGNPHLLYGEGAEWMYVPAEARYPREALEFCRYLVSPENGPDMGSCIGVISPLRGATPRASVGPALQSVLDIMDDAPGIFTCRLPLLFLEWNQQVVQPALAALMQGEIAPEEFGRRLDDGVTVAQRDPDVIIPPCTPYDPARFGETP